MILQTELKEKKRCLRTLDFVIDLILDKQFSLIAFPQLPLSH
jgi:hypothetical protein